MVKSAVSISANAKINLHMEVLGRRQDGFHNIVSLFVPISISDELLIEKSTGSSECCVYSPCFEMPEENTIVSAYQEFKKVSGIADGVAVRLIKNIPVGAGLGGGSADAAAVLKALNSMFDAGLSCDVLKAIALKIGSDVPFFLENKSSIVTGRGEFIKPVSVRTDYFGVLVYPGIKSSSKNAYSLLDRSYYAEYKTDFNPVDFCGKDCCMWSFFNSFEDVLFDEYPQIKEAKETVLDCGADFALMTGAGSSVFGLFKDEKQAGKAYLRLLKEYKSTFLFFLLAF